jgi:hypothetical protein
MPINIQCPPPKDIVYTLALYSDFNIWGSELIHSIPV